MPKTIEGRTRMKERTPSHRLQRNWDSPVTPRGDRQADLKADRQAEQKQACQWARSQLLRTFAQTEPQTQGQNTPPEPQEAATHPHPLERRIEWRLRALKQATRQVWICETRQANQWRALAVLRLLQQLPRPAALPRLNPSQELEQLGASKL